MEDNTPRPRPDVLDIATRLVTLAEKLSDADDIQLLHVAADTIREHAPQFVPGRKSEPLQPAQKVGCPLCGRPL